MLGRNHSAKMRRKWSKDRKGENGSFYGHSHTLEQRKKWSKERRGKPCPNCRRDKKSKEDISKRTKAYWDGLTEEEKAVRLSNYDFGKLRKNILHNGGKYSKLHAKVKKDMNRLSLLDFNTEEQIGRFVFDEVSCSRKIIIEVNGDYWHANPAKYTRNEKIAYPKGLKTAGQVWEDDNRKIDYAKDCGFKVIVLWEFEIKHGEHIDILRNIK